MKLRWGDLRSATSSVAGGGRMALVGAGAVLVNAISVAGAATNPAPNVAAPDESGFPTAAAQVHQRWLLTGLIVLLLVAAAVYRRRGRGQRAG